MSYFALVDLVLDARERQGLLHRDPARQHSEVVGERLAHLCVDLVEAGVDGGGKWLK